MFSGLGGMFEFPAHSEPFDYTQVPGVTSSCTTKGVTRGQMGKMG